MDQAQQLRNVIKGRNCVITGNARIITVTSGKGGVGKSNLSVNLAVCLRKAGKKVIIFDADFGLANVEVMFGAIPQFSRSYLSRKKYKRNYYKWPYGYRFYICRIWHNRS